MKTSKKLLSLVLSVAMMLSAVVAVPMTTSALDGYMGLPAVPKYGYTVPHMYGNTTGDTVVEGGYYNSDQATLAKIEASGYFEKSKTPCVTYYLMAENDCEVSMCTTYAVGGTLNDYSMTLDVNDKDYYVGSLKLTGTDVNKWVGEGEDMFYNVKLTKGLNIVRMLPTGKDDNRTVWCNPNALFVEVNKGVTALKVDSLQTTLQTANADFINRYSIDGTGLGNVQFGSTSYNTLCTENLSTVPYFSYTVDAPYSGYYDIDIRFNTGTVGGSGVLAAFVDGDKYKVSFVDFDNNRNADNCAINGTVYIPEGKHSLTFTAALERSSDGMWHDFSDIKIVGGLTVSDTKIDPTSFANTSMLWADTYASFNHTRLSDSGEKCSGSSDHVKTTFYQYDVADTSVLMQSYDSMVKNGLSDHNIVSFDYRVRAEKAGTYTVSPQIQFGNAVPSDGYFLVLAVNDKKFYKYDITAPGTYYPEFDIEVEEGINVIRVIAVCNDTRSIKRPNDANWINHEFLSLSPGLVGVIPGDSLELYAGQATHYANYTSNGNSMGGSATAKITSRLYDDSQFKIGDIAQSPYFAYTVTVPESGYYDISLETTCATNGAEGYINVFVDSVKYKKYYYQTKQWHSSASLTVYIPAGTHTLSFTNVWNWTGSGQDSGYTNWCDYAALRFIGGNVTKAATQVEPCKITDPTRLETDVSGYSNRFEDVSQSNPNASGGAQTGGANWDYNKSQASSTLSTYFDKSNMLYVSFAVNAPADGTYAIRPGYFNSTGITDHKLTILVNDHDVYTNSFTPMGSSTLNATTTNVTLKKGTNIIRLLPYTLDRDVGKGYVNMDYLDIDSRLTGADAKTYVQFEAENATYINKFSKGDSTVNSCQQGDLQNSGLNAETYTATNSNISITPFVSVTVEAPADGWYDITGCLKTGISAPDPAYMLMLVDGEKKIIGSVNDTGNDFAKSFADYTAYLTAGKHVLVFTSPMPKNASAEQTYSWVGFDYFRFYNGLKVADTQVNPLGTIDDYKATAVERVNALAKSGDPDTVATIISTAVSSINSYSSSESYESQVAAIDAIVAKAVTDVAAARVSAFDSYKTAKSAESDTKASIYSGYDSSSLIADAKSEISAVEYDTNKLYSENTATVDAIVEKLASDITAKLTADTEIFNGARKTAARNQINNQAASGDSAEVTALITKALADVDACQYDSTKSLAENGANLSAIIKALRTDIAAQKAAEKQEFEETKSAVSADIDTKAVDGDTAAIAQIIAQAKAQIESYVYDDTKTKDENIAAVNAIATGLDVMLTASRKAVSDQLHVWRQYENGITSESEEAYVRFIFTLDTETNEYTDYGFYITINGVEMKYSFMDCEIDNLGTYTPDYFDRSGKANKILYSYLVIPNGAFSDTIIVKAYFVDAAGEHIGEVSTANVASKFGFN